MARQAKATLYVAKESFSCQIGDDFYTVHIGDRVRAGHPLLKQNPGSFEDVNEHVRFEWENATTERP